MADLHTPPVRMRLFYRLLKQPVPKQIERYSRFSPSPLSIKQFLDFGKCDSLELPPRPRGVREPPSLSCLQLRLFSFRAKSVRTFRDGEAC